MTNVIDKSCRENQNTYFMFKNSLFSGNGSVNEIMWKNMVEPGRPLTTMQGLIYAEKRCKNTDAHT